MHSVNNACLLTASQYLWGGDAFGIRCVSYLSITFAKTEDGRWIERTNILVTFDRGAEMPVFI